MILRICHDNLGGGFKDFFYFHPDPWGNDPIGLVLYFSDGWFNHQLVIHGEDMLPTFVQVGFQALYMTGVFVRRVAVCDGWVESPETGSKKTQCKKEPRDVNKHL